MHDFVKRIDAAWAVYQQEIEYIADCMVDTKVGSYSKEHEIEFVCGMGTYYLSRRGKGVDPEVLPKWLRDILDCEIPGMPADSLGTIMDTERKR